MIEKLINKMIPLALKIAGVSLLAGLVLFFGILKAFPFPEDAIKNINYSTAVYDKDGHLLKAYTNSEGRWIFPISLDELDHNFIQATLAIEDRRFYQHKGVDFVSVIRAVVQNVSNGRKISGASTLTMQTVRLLENRPRTFASKLIETVHAIYLEEHYSKKDILRMYFELAPYGGNIQGIKAAAMKYFNKDPRDLTLSESALLAGLPQSPSRLRPDRYPRKAMKRREMVLKSMLKQGIIDQKEFELVNAEPVLIENYSMPSNAPHFSQMIMKIYPHKNVVTTIDSNIQHFAEGVLQDAIGRLRAERVTNGAIVVIENATGKVRALVGSVDFSSTTDFGQVNGATSVRSPGSALKPFTYALGFEKGLYSSASQIDDSPVRYGEYLPKNYDEEFHGLVSVREALVESLNIPAVEVLDKVGYGSLYSLLRQSGITTLTKSPESYGLSLTLGSSGVTLLELTNAYAMLARLGVYKPYVLEEGENDQQGKRIISDGAAYIVADILSDSSRLQEIGIYRNQFMPKVAFKTGTSYGQRDAWAFAYTRDYTIGVWLGNFSGSPSKALVGIEASVPVAFKIFDWLYSNQTTIWYDRPDSIGLRGSDDLFVKSSVLPVSSVEFSDRDKPQIISPDSGAAYFLSGPQGTPQKLPFSARPGHGTSEFYWFLNGRLLSQGSPGEKLFWPMKPGQYNLTCSDNFGRNSSAVFIVR